MRRHKNIPSWPELDMKVPKMASCPRCGGPTFVLPEGLIKCFNCKKTYQTCGANYRILRKR